MRPPLENPAAVLLRADAVMRAMQPAFSCYFHEAGIAYRARFEYPGVLSVYDRHSGDLVAVSEPGHPRRIASVP
jgi:hypothetical protein